MADAAFNRAERCFAVARSTSFAGERDAAIGRGVAIAEAAGIDLDRFDIPGRARSASRPGIARPRMVFRSRSAPDDYAVDEIGRLMREHLQRMRDDALNGVGQ